MTDTKNAPFPLTVTGWIARLVRVAAGDAETVAERAPAARMAPTVFMVEDWARNYGVRQDNLVQQLCGKHVKKRKNPEWESESGGKS